MNLVLELSTQHYELRRCEDLCHHRLLIAIMGHILTYHCLIGVIGRIIMDRIVLGLVVMMNILKIDTIVDQEGQVPAGMVPETFSITAAQSHGIMVLKQKIIVDIEKRMENVARTADAVTTQDVMVMRDPTKLAIFTTVFGRMDIDADHIDRVIVKIGNVPVLHVNAAMTKRSPVEEVAATKMLNTQGNVHLKVLQAEDRACNTHDPGEEDRERIV